jgi:hypothetical protein
MKKIVSVKHDDGTVMAVSDLQMLKRYVNTEITRESLRDLVTDTSIDWVTIGKEAEQLQASKLARRKATNATNSASASIPRKPVTKAMLIAFKEQYCSDYPDAKRGWKTAATIEFSIDPKTLSKRLKD